MRTLFLTLLLALSLTTTVSADTWGALTWGSGTWGTSSIVYNGNGSTGGSSPVDTNSPYVSGSSVTVLGAGTLVKTGYSFNGWNTAANGGGTPFAVDSLTTITKSTTLYAQWIPLPTYTLTYNGNGNTGGSAPVDTHSPYISGSTVTVLGAGTLTKTGYSFAGWNSATDGTGTAYAGAATFTITAQKTLFAQWKALPICTVTYNGNGNTGGSAPLDANSPYISGSGITVLGAGTLTKSGYTFAGWNSKALGNGIPFVEGSTATILASSTLYAQWAALPPTYTITYDGNGSTGGSALVVVSGPYVSGSSVPILGAGTLTKTGYTFAGWNTKANGSGIPFAVGSTATILASSTLYAQWTALPVYVVTYNGNGNTGGVAPADIKSPYITGSTVTVLGAGALTKTGYTFAGWNTAINGTGLAYAAGATFTIAAAKTLFAQWTVLPTFTITYNGNGNTSGSAPVDASSPYASGSTVIVLGAGTLAKTGYTFAGWNTAANGSGIAYAPAATFPMGSDNITLFASFLADVAGKPGDCDRNDSVTIDELQSAVSMFLGSRVVAECVDSNKDGSVSNVEVQKVINGLLGL